MTEDRFEVFADPFDDWIVWDTLLDDFASLGSQQLLSLPERDARAICHHLNRSQSRRAA